MTDVLIIIIAWYVIGAIGSALTLEFFFRRGSYPLDITVGTIAFGGVMAFLGPFNLVIGSLFVIGWLFGRGARRAGWSADRVIFRAHRD